MNKLFTIISLLLLLSSCGIKSADMKDPIHISFENEQQGQCKFYHYNPFGNIYLFDKQWIDIPNTIEIHRGSVHLSGLYYECKLETDLKAEGTIISAQDALSFTFSSYTGLFIPAPITSVQKFIIPVIE